MERTKSERKVIWHNVRGDGCGELVPRAKPRGCVALAPADECAPLRKREGCGSLSCGGASGKNQRCASPRQPPQIQLPFSSHISQMLNRHEQVIVTSMYVREHIDSDAAARLKMNNGCSLRIHTDIWTTIR